MLAEITITPPPVSGSSGRSSARGITRVRPGFARGLPDPRFNRGFTRGHADGPLPLCLTPPASIRLPHDEVHAPRRVSPSAQETGVWGG